MEEQEMELKELDHALHIPTHQTSSISSIYSLSSGPAHSNRSPSYSLSGRSKHKASTASSSSSYPISELSHRSPWQEDVDMDHHELPSINPSDHIKTLLSQLASSSLAMKGAFAHLQATLRVCNGAKAVTTPAITAEKVMEEELQRLSDLHQRLYSVLQDVGAMKQDMNGSRPESKCMQEYVCRNGEDGMLKSYEGIISRFYNEIRKKDAVAEALKETLAKSMLREEKLERRVKFLEAKLSSSSF